MTGTGPSWVTIAVPIPKARGWRSARQLFSSTSASSPTGEFEDRAVGREVDGLSGQPFEARLGDEGLPWLLPAGDVDGEEFVGAQPQEVQSCTVAGDLADPAGQRQAEGVFEHSPRG